MLWAARLGAQMGVTPEHIEGEIAELLTKYGLPHHIPCPWDVMEHAVCRDKKRGDDGIRVVLLHELGQARTEGLSIPDLLTKLKKLHGQQVNL